MLQRRFLCTQISKDSSSRNRRHRRQWTVKQVTRSNFPEALDEIKDRVFDSDFVAVSLQKTGSWSHPWHRVLPFDTAETAYSKAKYAADRFQILQFAVCPFSVRASNVIAHPYNFHLFPRDELRLGMPSYSFSCQSSYLTSMARDGFDFNACINDGISYLSREQESAAKHLIGNRVSSSCRLQSSSSQTVADQVFVERIKSRVRNWMNVYNESSTRTEDPLIISLRQLVVGSDVYGSRPSLNIDVCSERQVQLIVDMLKGLSSYLVPVTTPSKGGPQSLRVVLTRSEEDRVIFENELQRKEDEQNKHIRGFREVIDLISTSQKPVVAHNSLNDFTFIYSKFLAPLPCTVNEFRSSLVSVFPRVLDVGYLLKEISPPNKLIHRKARFMGVKF